ncbi:hypothetical protein [Rhodovulum sp. YEN HP10]|uniref:hypothetical protein n=1 Tax=Rhodovulum sp. HP10 TaxID=3387397 RepID=UPI0039DF6680
MSNDLGLFLRTLHERVKPELLLERVVGGPPDDWQRTLMNSTSDIIMVLASRRIGKSTTVGVMAGGLSRWRSGASTCCGGAAFAMWSRRISSGVSKGSPTSPF